MPKLAFDVDISKSSTSFPVGSACCLPYKSSALQSDKNINFSKAKLKQASKGMGNNTSVTTQTILKKVEDSPDYEEPIPLKKKSFTASSSDLLRVQHSKVTRKRSRSLSGDCRGGSGSASGTRSSRRVSKSKTKARKISRQHWLENERRTAERKEELFAAVIRGDDDTVERLLENELVDVNTTDSNHLTALHYAAMHARPNLITLLIRHGADVDAYDTKGGFTPIHWAVINSRPGMSEEERVDECLVELVKGGCNVNSKDFNQATPLHFAARTDNKAVVDSLMKLGADPNETDILGRTCASVAKSSETKILIIKLADLRARAIYHVLEIPDN